MGRQSLGRGFAAAVVLFAVALGACAGGGDDPGGSGSPVGSSSPTGGLGDPTGDPSPEPSVEPTEAGPPPLVWEPAPSKPAELAEWNEVGAEAFVHYAIDVLNYTQKFNDTDTLREISDDYCGFCADIINDFETAREAGVRRVGGELSFQIDDVGYQEASGLFYFDGTLEFAGHQEFVDDALVTEGRVPTLLTTFVVGLEDGEWLIFEAGTTPHD